MRSLVAILLTILTSTLLSGQESQEGRVSYITSQHIYVKFTNTDGIAEGDTLYVMKDGVEIPALQVKSFSSISCVCISLIQSPWATATTVHAKPVKRNNSEYEEVPVKEVQDEGYTEKVEDGPNQSDADKIEAYHQEISGRLSVSSYSDLFRNEESRNQRMRYTFSLNAEHMGNSAFSAESYISFSHTNSNWETVKDSIFLGLKIYNLALRYDINTSMHASLGRKINPRLSSLGAIDGLQVEKSFSFISVGAIVGSRPDYRDYSFNPDLLQYGGYLAHELAGKNGNMQNTLAFIEQTNQSLTDRRFAYFQHSSMLNKNLFVFASAEVDLYKIIAGASESTFELTNTYLSFRYRIIRPLSVGISYSARKNIIYYESYKDFLERLLDNEILQGWRIRVNYRPVKYMYLGLQGGYRFRKEDLQPSRNLNGYLTYSQIPGIGASVTLSSTWLETNYLKGMVYGIGINRSLLSNRLDGGMKYRYVDYFYHRSEAELIQHVYEAHLSLSIYRRLLLSLFYEGAFEKEFPAHRIYINLTRRF